MGTVEAMVGIIVGIIVVVAVIERKQNCEIKKMVRHYNKLDYVRNR